MNIRLSIVASAVALASPAMAQDAATATAEDKAAAPAKKKKITDRSHPDYRRCKSEPIIGSLARKRRTCMTNREWAAANREGNKNSRQFVEDMQVGSNGSN